MNILVSIITPTFNRAYILATAIQSILSQTYKNWEMVIIDDGSTDNTKELVMSFKDERIKYLYQKNAGPSAARNKAFSISKGEWIAYLDSDNELLPNYLEVMIDWITKNPFALYALPKGRRTLELYERDKLVKMIDDSEDFPENLTIEDIFMRRLHFDGNGFMHSRTIFEEGIRWDEKISRMEEWEFVMQIGERHPNNFLYVQVPLVNYHQRFGGDGLVSNTTYKQWAETFEYIYQKHKNDTQLEGQTWYPNRVKKYLKLEKDFQAGKAPAPHLRYFTKN